jgi:hypothetical protein
MSFARKVSSPAWLLSPLGLARVLTAEGSRARLKAHSVRECSSPWPVSALAILVRAKCQAMTPCAKELTSFGKRVIACLRLGTTIARALMGRQQIEPFGTYHALVTALPTCLVRGQDGA